MAFNSAIVDNLYDFDPVRRLFQYEGVAMETYRREHYLTQLRPFYDDSDLIKVITGIRRCGKSSLMNTVMDELLKLKVPKNNIIYINLDRREHRTVTTPERRLLYLHDWLKFLSTVRRARYQAHRPIYRTGNVHPFLPRVSWHAQLLE